MRKLIKIEEVKRESNTTNQKITVGLEEKVPPVKNF